jgi:hypothetical protein
LSSSAVAKIEVRRIVAGAGVTVTVDGDDVTAEESDARLVVGHAGAARRRTPEPCGCWC